MNKTVSIIWILGVFAGLVWNSALAQTSESSPPIEVHILQNQTLYLFSCWPAGQSAESDVWVYINQPDGIAGYVCFYRGDFEIKPLPLISPVEERVTAYERK